MKQAWFGLLLLGVTLTACSRDAAQQGIVIRVVDETREIDPFGKVAVSHRGVQEALVYLAPAGTPRAGLETADSAWPRCEADDQGRCRFAQLEGLFHALADLNADGVIDGWAFDVRSGTDRTITVTTLASLGDVWLQVSLAEDTVVLGATVTYALNGFLPTSGDVSLEVWREGAEREKIVTLDAIQAVGDVKTKGSLTIGSDWKPTPPGKVGDYLIVPVLNGKYFNADVFSVSSPVALLKAKRLIINQGDAITTSRNVALAFEAENAVYMTFSESVSALTSALRFPFVASTGFSLSPGDGVKTVWALFFDAEGNYAGPVSDTIVLDEVAPGPLDDTRFLVLMNPPGQDDYLSGLPGAAEPGALITVYGNAALTYVLTQGGTAADGSFGPLNIGDNQVVQPQDFVYVTATDGFGRESGAVPAYNDATPPLLRSEDITATWVFDQLAPGVGNAGDSIRAMYIQPEFFEPASDVVGGHANLSAFGGPSLVTMTTVGAGAWGADYTLPASALISGYRYVQVKIHDQAGNESPWMASLNPAWIDTVPPSRPRLLEVKGDNRMLGARWNVGAGDIAFWQVQITNSAGFLSEYSISIFDYYSLLFGAIQGAPEPGLYPFENLPNCHWYTVRVRAFDEAGNASQYSLPVSDRVILPPPKFEAWAGLSGTTGTIAFAIEPVTNGSSYELHFDTDSGVPYEYAGSATSPLEFPLGQTQLRYLRGLPLRTTFYVASRSRDDQFGQCASDYSAEMTAVTDLSVESFTDGGSEETLGGALALVSDANGDGVPDFLVGAPFPRYAALVSGVDTLKFDEVGYYWAPASYDIPGAGVGAADVDGDGRDEYIVGSPLESPGGLYLAGVVRVYDDDKTLLATFPGTREGQQFGYSIIRLGDLDLPPDGKEEYAVGGFGCVRKHCGPDDLSIPAEEGPGRVVVYDGASLSEKYEKQGIYKGDYFGISLASISDLDGDAVRDLIIGAPGNFRSSPGAQLYFVSGASGALIGVQSLGAFSHVQPGAALATLAGVPGEDELIVVGTTGADFWTGMVSVFRKNGSLVWRHSGDLLFAGSGFGGTLATGGDINGDGVPDVVVGAPLGAQAMFYGSGVAFVLDGKTGRVLYEMRGEGNDGSVGYSVLLPGNLVRGGRAEWVVGAPGSGHGGYQAGRLYLLTTDP